MKGKTEAKIIEVIGLGMFFMIGGVCGWALKVWVM